MGQCCLSIVTPDPVVPTCELQQRLLNKDQLSDEEFQKVAGQYRLAIRQRHKLSHSSPT